MEMPLPTHWPHHNHHSELADWSSAPLAWSENIPGLRGALALEMASRGFKHPPPSPTSPIPDPTNQKQDNTRPDEIFQTPTPQVTELFSQPAIVLFLWTVESALINPTR